MRKRIALGMVIFSLFAAVPGLAAKSPTGTTTAPADVPQNWLSQVQKDIAAREYYASRAVHKDPARDNILQAPNRRQNLRTWFTENGILVQRRVAAGQDWTFKLRPEKVGVAGALRKLTLGKPQAEGCRVTYPGKYLDEWFENRPEGLEQGFTIPGSLGDGELIICLVIEGSLKPQLADKTTLKLATPTGATVLEYGHLTVSDAANHKLPAVFSLSGSQLAIHIKTAGAVYPLTIDPLLMSLAWQVESNQAGAGFGFSVASAGDVNHDGFDDIIVGAPGYDKGEADDVIT